MPDDEKNYILLWRLRRGPWVLAAVVDTPQKRDAFLEAIRLDGLGFEYGYVEGPIVSAGEMAAAQGRVVRFPEVTLQSTVSLV